VKWLALAAGGGLGAMLRFALALWVDARAGVHFPWGTLAVNVAGCFGIGVLATLADEHALVSPALRLFLVTGLLGGFTTFSTFGMETWQLVEDGRALAALGNAGGSVVAGLAAVVAGVAITRGVLASL
jgi:CrcB protein